jgi:hypothetical protein
LIPNVGGIHTAQVGVLKNVFSHDSDHNEQHTHIFAMLRVMIGAAAALTPTCELSEDLHVCPSDELASATSESAQNYCSVPARPVLNKWMRNCGGSDGVAFGARFGEDTGQPPLWQE